MGNSITDQVVTTLFSALLGITLGALYDVIRISRAIFGIVYKNRFTEKLKLLKLPLIENPINYAKKSGKIKESVVLFLTDVIYFLIVTFVMIIFVYHVGDGVVRWYIFAGVMSGIMLYYFTLGKIVISISEYITFFIRVFLKYVIFFMTRPIAFLFKYLKIFKFKIKKSIKNKINKKNNCHQSPESKRFEIMRIGKI